MRTTATGLSSGFPSSSQNPLGGEQGEGKGSREEVQDAQRQSRPTEAGRVGGSLGTGGR